jgi:NTE family protein
VGLVLSGGGARGAYEVGVLSYIAEALPGLLERIRVITGASVGAVNGAFLAGGGLTAGSVEALAELWRGLVLDDLVSVAPTNALAMFGRASMRLFREETRSKPVGLCEVDGLLKLVADAVDWDGIARHVRQGRLDAVALAATDIASGDCHLFVHRKDELPVTWSDNDLTLIPRRVTLAADHVWASAAIPILFPPVRADGRWYMDGGIRYNTPLSPALTLGADALVIISVRTDRPTPAAGDAFPGLGHAAGKLLDAIFLDRIAFDLDRLTRINDLVGALSALGEDARETVASGLRARGRPMYRHVPFANVKPGRDLGQMAAEHLKRLPSSSLTSFGRILRALFEDDVQTTADAASFLLFDGGFAEALIEVGRRDARDAHETLALL